MNATATLIINGVSLNVVITISVPDNYQSHKLKLITPITIKSEDEIDLTIPCEGERNLYLKREGKSNIYKIGTSKDLKCLNRKKERMNSQNFQLIASAAGSKQLESRLHQLFADKKHGNGGREFFKLDTEDIERIKNIFLQLRLQADKPKSGVNCINKITNPNNNKLSYCHRFVSSINKDFCAWCLHDNDSNFLIDNLFPFLRLPTESYANESKNESKRNKKQIKHSPEVQANKEIIVIDDEPTKKSNKNTKIELIKIDCLDRIKVMTINTVTDKYRNDCLNDIIHLFVNNSDHVLENLFIDDELKIIYSFLESSDKSNIKELPQLIKQTCINMNIYNNIQNCINEMRDLIENSEDSADEDDNTITLGLKTEFKSLFLEYAEPTKIKIEELKVVCRFFNISKSGKKDDLIARIKNHSDD